MNQTLTRPLLLAILATTMLAATMAQDFEWPRRPSTMEGGMADFADYARDFGSQLLGDIPGLLSRGGDPNFDLMLGTKCMGALLGNVKRGVPKFPRVCCTITFFAPLCNEKNTEPA